jgi:aminopeptidase YwaD
MKYKNVVKSFSRIFPVILFVSLLSCSCVATRSRKVTTGELIRHIKYLSSDSLRGRLTGTQGDSLAAVYIKDRLAGDGLVPLAGDGFQRWGITNRITAGKKNFLEIAGKNPAQPDDLMPMSFSGNGELNAEVVFAGYGFNINNDSLKWDDYENIDVRGKWALILRGDPEPDKGISGFIPFSSDRDKALAARDQGASGVLLVSGPVFDREDKFDLLSAGDYSVEIPVLRIKREIADTLVTGSGKSTSDLEERINREKKPMAFATGAKVYAGSEIIREKSGTRNVMMLLPGKNEKLKNEYIIVGAHFDHLGMGGPGSGSRAPDTIAIHHGADDNASGVAEMLELAEKFALTKESHKRSMIFLSFSGEEEGLLGSKYFTENSPVDLSKVNAMINLDMVGRLRDSMTVQIGGVGTAAGLKDLVRSLADTNKVKLTFSEEGYGPSDHSSFYGKNIPVLFFTTGAHLDYHTPSDTWDKINYKGMVTLSDLIYKVTGYLADSPERLKFREAGPKIELNQSIRRRGITLGIMPDFAGNEKKGLRADFVTPGKPAALGGMKKGDIITSINGKTVSNIEDYIFRMSELKHGQTINVGILRNGSKLVLLIQL